MKKIFLLMWVLMLTLTVGAQTKTSDDIVVIENQPEGELRFYDRSGYFVKEQEKAQSDDDNPYEIITDKQTGTINIVFAPNNKVYFQHPVSELTTYDGWMEGTLSEDGKTITVPMFQYLAYAESFDMAVQVAMFKYDSEQKTYVVDESINEITYTINDDGSIKLNGTKRQLILGTMNRTFGDTFSYLDKEWLQSGDYGSVYTPFKETPLVAPEGLQTQNLSLTTAEFNGLDWNTFKANVKMGFDGDDAWLQGLCKYLPTAWVKGTRQGNTITISQPQFLGAYEGPIYIKGARINGTEVGESDIVLTFDGVDTYKTTDLLYITTNKDAFEYVNYYMGLWLQPDAEQPIAVPAALNAEPYVFSYRSNIGDNGAMENGQSNVDVAFEGSNVYIKGFWDGLPEAWVVANIEGDKLKFHLPQYLGEYTEEYIGTFAMYLTAVNDNTGELQDEVTLNYDAATKSFHTSDYPMSIGINKTGYLGLQDFYNVKFEKNPDAIMSVEAGETNAKTFYDIQGRKLNSPARGINIVRNADGTVRKVVF